MNLSVSNQVYSPSFTANINKISQAVTNNENLQNVCNMTKNNLLRKFHELYGEPIAAEFVQHLKVENLKYLYSLASKVDLSGYLRIELRNLQQFSQMEMHKLKQIEPLLLSKNDLGLWNYPAEYVLNFRSLNKKQQTTLLNLVQCNVTPFSAKGIIECPDLNWDKTVEKARAIKNYYGDDLREIEFYSNSKGENFFLADVQLHDNKKPAWLNYKRITVKLDDDVNAFAGISKQTKIAAFVDDLYAKMIRQLNLYSEKNLEDDIRQPEQVLRIEFWEGAQRFAEDDRQEEESGEDHAQEKPDRGLSPTGADRQRQTEQQKRDRRKREGDPLVEFDFQLGGVAVELLGQPDAPHQVGERHVLGPDTDSLGVGLFSVIEAEFQFLGVKAGRHPASAHAGRTAGRGFLVDHQTVVEVDDQELFFLVHRQFSAGGGDILRHRLRVAQGVDLYPLDAVFALFVVDVDDGVLIFDRLARFEDRQRLVDRRCLHEAAGLAQQRRPDFDLQVEAEERQEKGDDQDRRDDLHDRDAARPHRGDLTVGGHPPEDQHHRHHDRPRYGEGEDDRQNVERELQKRPEGNPLRNIIEHLDQIRAGHPERQNPDRHRKRQQKAACHLPV